MERESKSEGWTERKSWKHQSRRRVKDKEGRRQNGRKKEDNPASLEWK
jgi:hypothetical protein